MPRRLPATVRIGLASMLATAIIGGCAQLDAPYPENPSEPGKVVRLEQQDLIVEYRPDLDRVTFFGPTGGPNLLHTVELDRMPKADGSYTFYGGGYSWVAPQRGELGWHTVDGDPKDWPPDPAMDRGPMRVVKRSLTSITVHGPVLRNGLREWLTIEFVGRRHVTFVRELENTTDAPIEASIWSLAAVRPGDMMAVTLDAADTMWAPEPSHLGVFNDAAHPKGGWLLADTDDMTWADGVKVYADHAPVLAVHTNGWWLVREGEPMDEGTLRGHDESAIALYLHPGLALFEAELLGPIQKIEPGRRIVFAEHWRLMPSATANPDVLP
jgi:hypothetical protein